MQCPLLCHERVVDVILQGYVQTPREGARAMQGRTCSTTLAELRTRRVARNRRVDRRQPAQG